MATQRSAIDEVAVTEPVIMEVVAGARDDRLQPRLRRLSGVLY